MFILMRYFIWKILFMIDSMDVVFGIFVLFEGWIVELIDFFFIYWLILELFFICFFIFMLFELFIKCLFLFWEFIFDFWNFFNFWFFFVLGLVLVFVVELEVFFLLRCFMFDVWLVFLFIFFCGLKYKKSNFEGLIIGIGILSLYKLINVKNRINEIIL